MSAVLDVVIPCYNYADRVTHAVQSALACDVVAKVIVVNDGSTDNSAAVLSALANKVGPRLEVLEQANAGPSRARNAGLALTQSPWVMLLDADDELVPSGVKSALEMLVAAKDQDLILCAAEAVRDGQRPRLRPAPTSLPSNLFSAFLDGKIPISHGRFIASRSLIRRIPYPEAIRGQEDLPVYALMMALGRPMVCPAVTVRIHHHDASLRRNTVQLMANEGAVIEAIFKHPELPSDCQSHRDTYYARRLLSIFRALAKQQKVQAGAYFWKAFRLKPFSRRWWKQLPRYVRWLAGSKDSGERSDG